MSGSTARKGMRMKSLFQNRWMRWGLAGWLVIGAAAQEFGLTLALGGAGAICAAIGAFLIGGRLRQRPTPSPLVSEAS